MDSFENAILIEFTDVTLTDYFSGNEKFINESDRVTDQVVNGLESIFNGVSIHAIVNTEDSIDNSNDVDFLHKEVGYLNKLIGHTESYLDERIWSRISRIAHAGVTASEKAVSNGLSIGTGVGVGVASGSVGSAVAGFGGVTAVGFSIGAVIQVIIELCAKYNMKHNKSKEIINNYKRELIRVRDKAIKKITKLEK